MSRIPPIESLVPHEEPMIWLDELVDWKPGFARCRASVHEHTALADADGLASEALLEHMAQAVAACLGYGALQSGEKVRVGMVIACRSFVMDQPRVPMGAQLVVEAESVREVDEVSNYACQVLLGETRVAQASLTLYHASKPPS